MLAETHSRHDPYQLTTITIYCTFYNNSLESGIQICSFLLNKHSTMYQTNVKEIVLLDSKTRILLVFKSILLETVRFETILHKCRLFDLY